MKDTTEEVISCPIRKLNRLTINEASIFEKVENVLQLKTIFLNVGIVRAGPKHALGGYNYGRLYDRSFMHVPPMRVYKKDFCVIGSCHALRPEELIRGSYMSISISKLSRGLTAS